MRLHFIRGKLLHGLDIHHLKVIRFFLQLFSLYLNIKF